MRGTYDGEHDAAVQEGEQVLEEEGHGRDVVHTTRVSLAQQVRHQRVHAVHVLVAESLASVALERCGAGELECHGLDDQSEQEPVHVEVGHRGVLLGQQCHVVLHDGLVGGVRDTATQRGVVEEVVHVGAQQRTVLAHVRHVVHRFDHVQQGQERLLARARIVAAHELDEDVQHQWEVPQQLEAVR